jgi:hypothetical protein
MVLPEVLHFAGTKYVSKVAGRVMKGTAKSCRLQQAGFS